MAASHTSTTIPRGGGGCRVLAAGGQCSEVFQDLPNQTKEEATHSLLMNMNFRVEKMYGLLELKWFSFFVRRANTP